MKHRILGLVLLLAFVSQIVRADLLRTPLKAIPRLFGRDVERLVLLTPIVVNRSKPGVAFAVTMMVRIVPGTFIPVTEDADGIFYQAVNGYTTIRGNRPTGGGLYLSKSRPGVIWAYVGDARMGSKIGVDKDTQPLPADALHNLRTGKAERPR
jgi:hypothetical protein